MSGSSAVGAVALPAPPDGAPLADLAERRQWLGRLEVAQLLPREGLLWLAEPEDASSSASVSVDVRTLVARPGPFADAARVAQLSSADREALTALWPALWSEAAPEHDAAVLLHYRGLFRRAGGDAAARLGAWLSEVLSR